MEWFLGKKSFTQVSISNFPPTSPQVSRKEWREERFFFQRNLFHRKTLYFIKLFFLRSPLFIIIVHSFTQVSISNFHLPHPRFRCEFHEGYNPLDWRRLKMKLWWSHEWWLYPAHETVPQSFDNSSTKFGQQCSISALNNESLSKNSCLTSPISMDQDKEDEEKKFIRDTTMVCYKPPWGATFGSPLGGRWS